MSDTDMPRDVKAALDFARKTTEPKILTATFEGGEEQILVTTEANGVTGVRTIRDLFDDRAERPVRREGTIVVHDLASFVAATNRDSNASSVIFADAPGCKVTAILDFHTAGGGAPRWGGDRIEYGFTLSPQLQAWQKAAAALMDQKTFSRLIDDRLGDVGDPGLLAADSIATDFATRRGISFASAADLICFTRTIAVKATVESEEMFDANTGGTSIQYKKKNDVKTPDGAPVPVPPAFVLLIPILCGKEATLYSVGVRLRYDVDGSRIAWRIELHALEKYLLAAIEEALEVVRGPKEQAPHMSSDVAPEAEDASPPFVPGCGLPVFMGVAPAV